MPPRCRRCRQALVRANPVNGRKAFYVASHACEIVGMPSAEARVLIRELLEPATRPELVYTHRWQVGDLVMWDNRCMLHRGRPWDEIALPPRHASHHGGRRGADRARAAGSRGEPGERGGYFLGPRPA